MLERLPFATRQAVEKHRFNLHRGWIRLAELFFGGFLADENSAANTAANGAGLGV